MKKNFIIVIFLTLLSFLIVFNSCQNNTPNNKPWKLIVLNQEIPTTQIQVIDGEVCVPLIPVLLAYGYEVEWLTDAFAVVTKAEKKYYLDLSTRSLYEEGKENSVENNKIYGIEGGPEISVAVEKDVLLCLPLLNEALHRLKEPSKIRRDRKECIVTVERRVE